MMYFLVDLLLLEYSSFQWFEIQIYKHAINYQPDFPENLEMTTTTALLRTSEDLYYSL